MRLKESFYRRKVHQVQAALAQEELDGVLLLDSHNVIYASGFFHIPSERPLGLFIPSSGSPTLFVPLLEQENAADTWIEDIRTYFEFPGEQHPVNWMVGECNCSMLGIDSLSHELFMGLGDGVRITHLVEKMRWVKDPEEIALIEKAASYADFCLSYLLENAGDIIRDGGTELDLLNACISATAAKMKGEVEDIFRLHGGSIVGTVHSGARAALPHGSPIARKPQRGETIIAGIGAAVGGYHAESGATFIVDAPQGDQMHCLQAAVDCDAAGVAALRAGDALCGCECSGVGCAARGRLKRCNSPSDWAWDGLTRA